MKKHCSLIFITLTLMACSNESPNITDKTQVDFAKKQTEYEKNRTDLEEQDRPQFDVPAVDYTTSVAKINLHNDDEIIKSVGLPVVEKEVSTNQNGEPMTTYYFSNDNRNGLELSLSREFVDVAWVYDANNSEKATAAFNDGQRITRALLGGQDGTELYEKISKGLKFDLLTLPDGVEIKNARCGQSMCRYQIMR